MSFTQPQLPYDLGALSPFLSEEQMSYHYGKHHAAYFTNLNGLVDGKAESDMSLKDVVAKAEGPVFNNAAQAWNHSFFWHCMSPSGGGAPQGALLTHIERDFGSFNTFKEQFSTASAKLFGSGWAWLAMDSAGKLEIMSLSNADTPVMANPSYAGRGNMPIIDYRNLRPKFIEGFWDVVNWDFVAKTLATPFKE